MRAAQPCETALRLTDLAQSGRSAWEGRKIMGNTHCAWTGKTGEACTRVAACVTPACACVVWSGRAWRA
eukprot:3687451-Pleurochrysis_carterae.AAC.2